MEAAAYKRGYKNTKYKRWRDFCFFGANVREGKEQRKQGERECFNRKKKKKPWFSLEQKKHEGTGWSNQNNNNNNDNENKNHLKHILHGTLI